ncbi:MAG: TAT-variant-translocated molybdopterin oxidoreductase [Acidobacteriota bacterium]|nr:TAT-variant-translocated molybdopterin oxidoreductase [Acidobacteriota bacterium]
MSTTSTAKKRLLGTRGREFWRSLEELADDPEFEQVLHREFPEQAAVWPEGVDRRRFLQLTSASLALAGLAGCTRQPPEKIVPYVNQPEELIPGQPLYFASAFELDGYANGILVESHMGRPTKIEGNPDHPASLGATDLFAQAAILSVYDPDRSQAVRHLNRIRTWRAFVDDTRRGLNALNALGGARLRILTGPVTSPTLAAKLDEVLATYPQARWHQYSAAGRHSGSSGSRMAFGMEVATRYDFRQAKVVLSLDADFLNTGAAAVRYARDFMGGRQIRSVADSMNRLYVAEMTPSGTGAAADHRLPVPAGAFDQFTAALASALGIPEFSPPELDERLLSWVRVVARDLEAHRGACAVIAGAYCSPAVHALVHILNDRLGNNGRTVLHSDPIEARPVDQLQDLQTLVRDMSAGEVDALVVLAVNPVFDAPADLDFAAAMMKVSRRIHLGLHDDETAELCHWHVPQAHDLESWGDARAFDGTVTLRQPLIDPLYGGKCPLELLQLLLGDDGLSNREILERFWQQTASSTMSVAAWRKAVHDGFIRDSQKPPRAIETRPDAAAEVAVGLSATTDAAITVVFRPDPTIYDGRFANNGWLQECPKPLSKLTWDNAAIVGPALAARMGVANEQMVRLELEDRALELPIWIQPGQADRTLTLHLGHGRSRAGRVGTDTGFNAYSVRTSTALWRAPGARVTPLATTYPLATTQLHHNIAPVNLEGEEAEKRHLVRIASLETFRHHPEFAKHAGHAPTADVSLYPPYEYNGYAWGLSVDLGACTGCNACVLACQSENNIAVVGKDQVQMGREMHWIRIDRYFAGDLDDPQIHHQPVMCMHCEQAPCEVVCPVAATTHSSEGLNEMTYNRCVGTRYCSNNCPYKVRRFNFLKYSDYETPVLSLMRNPDVTVRFRGVMEKCTYCVQRINHARITAEKENRKISDGEIVTACQQVCPSEAIVFGDLNDPESEAVRRKSSSLDYGILEELSTKPRTTYLARVQNPNSALEAEKKA